MLWLLFGVRKINNEIVLLCLLQINPCYLRGRSNKTPCDVTFFLFFKYHQKPQKKLEIFKIFIEIMSIWPPYKTYICIWPSKNIFFWFYITQFAWKRWNFFAKNVTWHIGLGGGGTVRDVGGGGALVWETTRGGGGGGADILFERSCICILWYVKSEILVF